jgi:hypothetical protein
MGLFWRCAHLALLTTLALPAAAQTGARFNIKAVDVTAPANAVESDRIIIGATFESDSSETPPSFRWSVYLTTNGLIDGGIYLGRFGPIALGASETRAVSQQVTLPVNVTGGYTFAVVADATGVVNELDEYDNIASAANLTRIRAEAPDLAITHVGLREPEAREGETIHVEITVENRGELDATVPVGAYMSTDPLVTGSDLLLGSTDVTVVAGGRVEVEISAVVPTVDLAGDHPIGAIADAAGAVVELNEVNNVRSAARPLIIYRDTLSIITDVLPEGTRTIDYHAKIEARGGDGHYNFAITSGRAPAGLTLDPITGILAGVPTESGEHRFTVEVSSHGLEVSKAWTVLVSGRGEALTIVTLSLQNAAISLPYAQNLIAAGGEPPYTWTVLSGSLPPGLDLRSDGVISGEPNVLGEFELEVEVIDRLGESDSALIQIVVTNPVNVLILDQGLPEFPIGVAIDVELQVTGGVPPHQWQAVSTPPPGLTISENGRLTGTPSRVGRFPVLVRADDASRADAFDSRLIEVVVVDDGALQIDTASLRSANLRSAYEAELVAHGGTPPLKWSVVPGDFAPQGFFLTQGDGTEYPADSGVLKGTAIRSFVHAFTVQVEDAYGRRATKLYALEVLGVAATNDVQCVCATSSGRSAAPLAMFVLFGLALVLRKKR